MADTTPKTSTTSNTDIVRSKGPGRPTGPEKQFDEKTLHLDRVARVVKGGRRFRFRALVVVGDRKGKVGIGSAKGADVSAAITKATDVAKKSMITVSLKNGTLPHDAQAKVSGANILIKPASEGTGLIAGGAVRPILEACGVRNVLSKSLGSTNKTNTAYATLKALGSLRSADSWVTRQKESAKKPASLKSSNTKAKEAAQTNKTKSATAKKTNAKGGKK